MDAVRRPGPEALKALAHPLRVRLFSELSAHGPATATVLGDRLGESSGATSYHLRQLEKHGFVREDETRGTARERWWERVPGPVEFPDPSLAAAGAGREALDIVDAELRRLQTERYLRYLAGRDGLGPHWVEAAVDHDSVLTLTPAELSEVGHAVDALLDRYRGRAETDGRRRVELQLRGFPLVDP